MKIIDLSAYLREHSYPGRGILLGRSADNKHAVIAYFIMGRSANSRNRVFTPVAEDNGIMTEAYDPSKMEDPSLIIYHPVRYVEKTGDTVVTNGDQTDTVRDGILEGKVFAQALRVRCFEPDPPNYTPRISGVVRSEKDCFHYALSILKSNNGDPSECLRFTFAYDRPLAGEGHFISTYKGNGNPLPSFEGEPIPVEISGDLDTLTAKVWESLNPDNRVSLFVRFLNFKTGRYETRIVNKNKG